MVSVFAAHAAQPFNPWDVWHVQSREQSKWLGELVLFVAPWVMPLFIMLAGASAWHSLGKRSTRAYLHERVSRLIVPFAAGILLVVPPQVYFDRRQHGVFDGSFFEFYPHFFEGVYPRGNFTWSHLWFLGILALLALVTAPFFRWLRSAGGRQGMSRLATICAPPGAILLLAVPMMAVRAALWMLFPDARLIVTDWSNRTILLPMFAFGYMLGGEPSLMHAVDRQWKLALTVAIVFSTAMVAWAWPGDFTQRFTVPFSASYVLMWSAYALGGLAWSIALLGAARACRIVPGRLLARGRELLNPFYILHQTVIVVFAFYLLRADTGPLVTFATLIASAFLATTALSTLAVRSRLARSLFGGRAPTCDPVHHRIRSDHAQRSAPTRAG